MDDIPISLPSLPSMGAGQSMRRSPRYVGRVLYHLLVAWLPAYMQEISIDLDRLAYVLGEREWVPREDEGGSSCAVLTELAEGGRRE